jgi:hypothetical protein
MFETSSFIIEWGWFIGDAGVVTRGTLLFFHIGIDFYYFFLLLFTVVCFGRSRVGGIIGLFRFGR